MTFVPSGENATDHRGLIEGEQLPHQRLHPRFEWFRHLSQRRFSVHCERSNETEFTFSSCPRNSKIVAPVVTSQTRMVVSNEPETIRLPSGGQFIELMSF
jgi:hypothetical protein